jgi:hypothetical protein
MKRILLATTLGVLPIQATPLFAATCSVNGLDVTCAGDVTAGFSNSTAGLQLEVTSGSTVSNAAGDAIRTRGNGVTVTNNGTISGTNPSGSDGIDGGNSLTVTNNGTITATNKGIDADEKNDLTVINNGSITAYDKAIRNADGNNASLTNATGALIESEIDEGFESGDNAYVLNKGTIRASDDAIQVGNNATIINYGLIESVTRGGDEADPQDGIDIDSGSIENYGTIRSDDDAAIDYDASDITSTITNAAGATISGTTGVLVEKGHFDEDGEWQEANIAAQIVKNWGVIEGRSGFGLDLGAGDDDVSLYAGSTLIGGADLGEDDDTLTIFGDLVAGIVGDALLEGGTGTDIVSFASLGLSALLTASFEGDFAFFTFANAPEITLSLANWEGYGFGDRVYSQAEIEAALAPVPLPAAGLLMVPALGALAALRRRRRAA